MHFLSKFFLALVASDEYPAQRPTVIYEYWQCVSRERGRNEPKLKVPSRSKFSVRCAPIRLYQALAGDGQCKDINGVSHETGNHYVPGPEPCTLCVCNNGNPTWCKTVYCKHTTLPRQSTAYTISSSIPNTSVGSHRTIPRSLANNGSGGGGSSSLRLPREESSSVHQSVAAPIFEKLADHSDNIQSKANNNRSPRSMLPVSIVPSSVSSALTSCEAAVSTNTYYNSSSIAKTSYTFSKAAEPKSSSQTLASLNFKPPLASANQVNEEGSFDSVTCSCNNGQAAAAPAISTIHDDDYRSECENCKSASASRYYAGNEDELVASPRETMTLQRRPAAADAEAHRPNNSTCQYYRTCHTLPTNTKQQQRTR
ncbi:unnamed protein product [Trichogramma brassicae]|uniref:VWFC domain-containing protein n=1 Tax=Trichogramma brassicae TaxID=86971 RepID=A0A6H5IB57_9HYME|nr:unnamed protein product [Trichogramma brassicae]